MSMPERMGGASPEPTVSAVLIVKNEEKHLAECLSTLSWADEVLVLDSGSTDRTLEIAARHGARVEVRSDWQGFGEQRRRAEALATGDWVFMIDADERVTPELEAGIRQAILQSPAVYEVNRLPWCFGRFIRHSGLHPDWIPRLYPRGQAGYLSTRVHERLQNPNGLPERRLQGLLLHYTSESLRHHLLKSAHYSEEWATERAAQGKTTWLLSGFFRGFFCFFRMYLLRAGFLDGPQGFLIAVLMSHYTFTKYADLWTRTRSKRKE